MKQSNTFWPLVKKLGKLLERRQRAGFIVILLILGISAVLSQITPLAVGYLTDRVLAEQTVRFAAIIPILLGILVVNVVNAGPSRFLTAGASAPGHCQSGSGCRAGLRPGWPDGSSGLSVAGCIPAVRHQRTPTWQAPVTSHLDRLGVFHFLTGIQKGGTGVLLVGEGSRLPRGAARWQGQLRHTL